MPSLPTLSWKPLAAIAAGAAALLAVMVVLLKEEEEDEPKQDDRKVVHEILNELVEVEELAKRAVDEMVKMQLDGKELSMDEAYKRVEKLDLYDPLEKRKMGVQEFEMMVTQSQHDPFVIEMMARLSGAGPAMDPARAKPDFDVAKILEVKGFSVDELQRQVDRFLKQPDAKDRDFKAATIALKALVHAQVEKKHGVSNEDIEAAAVVKQAELFSNPAFLEILKKQQQAMQLLLGVTMSAPPPPDIGGGLD
ncbi:unnamed protein product [Durusdinium trenchii]|uniref:Uncharacterized protein n=2 Tax=Durusdinium trenchii TaxID=1381693 RepID=A0ABP0LI12_9DINO